MAWDIIGIGGECAMPCVNTSCSLRMAKCDLYTYIYIYITSSTAQGGGGSFKNRKPIGEIGCCESGMAERIH